MAIQEKSYVI